MMYTGRTVDAEEALAWGLVNEVVPPEELLEGASRLAARVCGNAPFSVALTKEMFQLGLDAASLEHTLVSENRTQVLAGFSSGPVEAVAHSVRAKGRDRARSGSTPQRRRSLRVRPPRCHQRAAPPVRP